MLLLAHLRRQEIFHRAGPVAGCPYAMPSRGIYTVSVIFRWFDGTSQKTVEVMRRINGSDNGRTSVLQGRSTAASKHRLTPYALRTT